MPHPNNPGSILKPKHSIPLFKPKSRYSTKWVREKPRYYDDLLGPPQLLARSSSRSYDSLATDDWAYFTFEGSLWRTKKIPSVGDHPLKSQLETGLRGEIRKVLNTFFGESWVTCDYVRMGFNWPKEEDSPVVVLVTVEKDTVDVSDAKRVVDEIGRLMLKYALADVETEVMEVESPRMTASKELEPTNLETFGCTEEPLYVGSSIGVGREHKADTANPGTLGGLIDIDGAIYGLTNHHVLTGPRRRLAYSNTSGSAPLIRVNHPALIDLQKALWDRQYSIELLKSNIPRYESAEEKLDLKHNISVRSKLRCAMSHFGRKNTFGDVHKTSGLKVKQSDDDGTRQHRLDWGLIVVDKYTRIPRNPGFSNKLTRWIFYPNKIYDVLDDFRLAGGYKFGLPRHFQRGLLDEELESRLLDSQKQGRKVPVLKLGRTTDYTWGTLADIRSDYRCPLTGNIIEEWAVHSSKKYQYSRFDPFSDEGDDGALVFDKDSYVLGMIWGQVYNTGITYMTSMQTVLEDIKMAYNAKEVKLMEDLEEKDIKEKLSNEDGAEAKTKAAEEPSRISTPTPTEPSDDEKLASWTLVPPPADVEASVVETLNSSLTGITDETAEPPTAETTMISREGER